MSYGTANEGEVPPTKRRSDLQTQRTHTSCSDSFTVSLGLVIEYFCVCVIQTFSMESPGTELSSVGLHITTKAQVTAWASDLENLGELHNEFSADPRHLSSETSERAIETFPHLELVTAPSSPGEFTPVAAVKHDWWIPLAAMCVWFVSSITISLLNKELFGLLNIHIPCFVTGFHNFTMTVILFIIRHSVPNAPEFPSMHWATFFRYYFPIALLSSVDILATNSSFQFVSIGTITVIKSSLCVVTYCAGMAFGVERFEWSLFVCSLWILFSISLTVPKMEVHSVVGIVLLIVAVISSAIRWVWTQLRMQAALCPSPITPLQMMYVTVPANTVLLFTFGLFTEVPEFASKPARLIRHRHNFSVAVPQRRRGLNPQPDRLRRLRGLLRCDVGICLRATYLIIVSDHRWRAERSPDNFHVDAYLSGAHRSLPCDWHL